MSLDPEVCYRALLARDARFDGRFFTCVKTTGIYCRPICPVPPPRAKNCVFVPSAAAAQLAGFRPCLRCRPELSPDVAAWRGSQATVSRALALVAEGALDDEAGVATLAERLGIGERQLRRLFAEHLGASPLAVAQTRRVLFAKQLVQDTSLPMTEIAHAAGFGSVRRFNAVFRALYARPPGELRRGSPARSSTIRLRLAYRPPYDWDAMLGFFAGRAIPGVERVDGDRYGRTLSFGGAAGSLEIAPTGKDALEVALRLPSVRGLPALVASIRRVFDLDADVATIGAHLRQDEALAPLVARRPGLRTPGGWTPFEQAIRAVLGQQITVSGARQLAARLVALAGSPCDVGDGLTHLFPAPDQLLAADLSTLGMPRSRRATLVGLAEAARDPAFFAPAASLDEAVARLRRLSGFGEWTAQYVALRALGHADAFPGGDVALQRSAAASEKDLLRRAEAWRPWRGYAAQHLWAADQENHV
jgi:AraC family transcriptional regulator of adaptative response / DNA-3-methyladenine glycosylase II